MELPTENYKRNNQTSRIGGTVKIPAGSIGITVAPIDPFSDSVHVSWLQDLDFNWSGAVNQFEIHGERRPIEDDEPVTLPERAVTTTVFEPPGSDNVLIYWLD